MKDAIGMCWEFKHESLRDVPLYLLSEGKKFVVALDSPLNKADCLN